MNNKLELLCNIKNILGEGPYYDYRNGSISWIDIVGKKLCIYDKNKEVKEALFDEKLGSAIPLNDSNGFLVCCETKLYLYDGNNIKEYMDISGIVNKGMRCNDAKADRNGRLWFSTMVDDGVSDPNGGLYTIINGEIVCMQKNTKLGNGLAWSKDDTKFYYNDSIEHKVYVYDYDISRGLISNRRVLVEMNDVPDGMTIDENDNLFIAIWGGSRIEVRSGSTGELIDIIDIPTKLVTSCTFSGNNYDELIITTASLNEKDEYAGKVFKLKTKYKGLPENFVKIGKYL